MKAELFKRPDLLTQDVAGRFYFPAQSPKPVTAREVITYYQNYVAEFVDDMNDAFAALGSLERCCYSGAIHKQGERDSIELRLNGKLCRIYSASLEDAFHDESFPPPQSLFRKEIPTGAKSVVVLQDDTLDTFHAAIRRLWVSYHDNWKPDERVMKTTPLGRVALAMGYKPDTPLLDQDRQWIDAAPAHLLRA